MGVVWSGVVFSNSGNNFVRNAWTVATTLAVLLDTIYSTTSAVCATTSTSQTDAFGGAVKRLPNRVFDKGIVPSAFFLLGMDHRRDSSQSLWGFVGGECLVLSEL